MTKISIIIPIYNALSDLKILLNSLNTYLDFNICETFLINDCSDKETTEFLEDFYKNNNQYKYLKNDENLGFVQTCNRGMKIASGDIIILLNSDTEIPKDFCKKIINCFNSDPQIGLASPISSSPDIPLPENYNLEKMNNLLNSVHQKEYPLLPSANGFCFCIRKEVIKSQGYLDTIWGKGYCEEIDYAYRAITNGWKNVLIDDLYVYHKHHASFGEKQRKKLIEQNNPEFMRRWKNFGKNYIKKNKLKNPTIKIEKKMFPKGNPARLKFYNSPLEYIYSCKQSLNKTHKVITILGIKIKILNKDT